MPLSIDINCDLGEGCDNDAELMRYISSANIACGFHAGDEDTMRRTVELAIRNNVAIGAHPGYRDKENFGRTAMQMPYGELQEIVVEQVSKLRKFCDISGARLHHVKPHGALYNQAAKDREIAAAIAEGIQSIDDGYVFFGLPNSIMLEEAQRVGLLTASEVFADRTYQNDGTLTPRSHHNAMIENIDKCVEHVLGMVRTQKVIATDGSEVPIRADTICVHGDGPNAVGFAAAIHRALEKLDIEIRPN